MSTIYLLFLKDFLMKKYNITLWLLVLYYIIYFINANFIEKPKQTNSTAIYNQDISTQ